MYLPPSYWQRSCSHRPLMTDTAEQHGSPTCKYMYVHVRVPNQECRFRPKMLHSQNVG